MVAQATTTKRSAITLEQHFCWHTTVDADFNMLRSRNTGLCKLSGKAFGEVMHHFITGSNETCFMACEDGYLHVIGAEDKRKHEKQTSDSRESITI